jgi:DNA-binding LacI/PurR family transcriptional regulator
MSDKKGRDNQPTLDDVAKAAGVNRVTASIALRGPRPGARGGTRISEATRQRIIETARELGYAPNAIALAFRRQRTDLIGFYTGYGNAVDPHLPFMADVLHGLQQGCARHQQDLVIYGGFARHSTNEIYSALVSGKIDGLVVLPSPQNPVVEKLVHSYLPAVAIANTVAGLPSVTVDDIGGSQLLATYLARKGHRRVLYRTDTVDHVSPGLRRRSFLQAAAAHDLEVIVSLPESSSDTMTAAEHALLTGPLHQRPSVVVCWVDTSAYAFLADCAHYGIRVPEDIAVAGFDGIVGVVPPLYRLTTVRAPWRAVTECAVDLVMQLIENHKVPPETTLPVELIVGETA